MPRIFRKLCWWMKSSCWHILAVLFQVSLAYIGRRDDEGGVEVQFNLEAKHAGSPHVKSSEDCCYFCQSSVDICFISIARYYTSQVGESFYIFYVPLCSGYWLWWWALGDSHGLRFLPAYIQSNLCALFFKLGSHLLAYILFLRHYRYVIIVWVPVEMLKNVANHQGNCQECQSVCRVVTIHSWHVCVGKARFNARCHVRFLRVNSVSFLQFLMAFCINICKYAAKKTQTM